MSVGIQVFASDGTVLLDSTKHIWSIVQSGFVPKRQSVIVPLPPEIANSQIEVRLTKWNGVVPGNVYIEPTPVYGITENAISRLTELFFDYYNIDSIRTDPYTSIPTTLGINNNKLLYLIFFDLRVQIDQMADAASLFFSGFIEGNQTSIVTGQELMTIATQSFSNLGFSEKATLAFSDLGYVAGYMVQQADIDYVKHRSATGQPYTLFEAVKQLVKEVAQKSKLGYEINDTVLDTYSAPVVTGSQSRQTKALPSWSITNNQLRFEADGDETVRFEVYAK